MYVNENKSSAVLFSYTLTPLRDEIFYPVKLQGLNAQKMYKLQEINVFPNQWPRLPENGKTLSGDYRLKIGIQTSSGTRQTSSVIEITEVRR